jgi:hypothetical protein
LQRRSPDLHGSTAKKKEFGLTDIDNLSEETPNSHVPKNEIKPNTIPLWLGTK